MRKRNFLVGLLYFLFTTIAFGQVELNFDFDYARFKYDTNSVYLEFYYNLNSKNMFSWITNRVKNFLKQ